MPFQVGRGVGRVPAVLDAEPAHLAVDVVRRLCEPLPDLRGVPCVPHLLLPPRDHPTLGEDLLLQLERLGLDLSVAGQVVVVGAEAAVLVVLEKRLVTSSFARHGFPDVHVKHWLKVRLVPFSVHIFTLLCFSNDAQHVEEWQQIRTLLQSARAETLHQLSDLRNLDPW